MPRLTRLPRHEWIARAITLAVALAPAVRAPAQEADSTRRHADSTGGPGLGTRAQETVSPVAAGLLEYFIPVAGHAYAGNPRRGLGPLAVTVAGLGLLIWDSRRCDSNVGCGYLPHAMALTVGGRLWGIQSAVSTAMSRNRRLQERVRFRVGRAHRGRRHDVVTTVAF